MAAEARATHARAHVQPTIEKIKWPTSLRSLRLSDAFHVIEVVWGPDLPRRRFSKVLIQPFLKVPSEESLQKFEFGDAFDKPIADCEWPPSVRVLAFGDEFDQAIDGVVWPKCLERVAFGKRFDQQTHCIPWPAPLRSLTVDGIERNNHGNGGWGVLLSCPVVVV